MKSQLGLLSLEAMMCCDCCTELTEGFALLFATWEISSFNLSALYLTAILGSKSVRRCEGLALL